MTPPFPSKFHDISAYLAGQSGEGGRRVADICRRIEEDVPLAEGRLSYRMPAYFLEGSLVYFAAFKKHIGFYPASDTVFERFREALAPYKQSGRGTVQFQHNQVLPLDLIRQIVAFRVRENRERSNGPS